MFRIMKKDGTHIFNVIEYSIDSIRDEDYLIYKLYGNLFSNKILLSNVFEVKKYEQKRN